ncbi:daptide-type RiPP biosynthesis dehydogenase [Microbacterium paraoxydans]|uniref:daptide-type RiPP biosynthesis dehydogenase n=1 Tax=Microbacterium paraoxydans TaxID=199592 RepID=UPI001CFB205E|nr:daptide-type RiPP biosynthesis dehydogenase [Microbacterium paraoxydans]
MTTAFARRTPTLWHGPGVADHVVTQLTAGREILVIADSAIPVPFRAASAATTITVDASSVDVAFVSGIARQVVRRSPEVIVAVGGGSVLDASKIAALALAPGKTFDYAIGHAERSSLTVLPYAPPPVELVAVPTTLGTSSETNSVGILKNDSGYRLIVGHSLRPRHAVIDPRNLESLTHGAVREGALEAFLRLAGTSTSSGRSPRGSSEAVILGRALLETVSQDAVSSAGRLRLARLSAATQRGAALRGRDPYSARHWYLANEVAFVLGVRKMVATAAVIAAVWRRICAGDTRWGDRESLLEFWSRVASGVALPLEPAAGITALIERWEIPLPPRPTAREADRISTSTESSWGDRRPMLTGLVADDIREVLHDSCWGHPYAGEVRRPSTATQRR